MKDHRNIIWCDCCARQIVERSDISEHWVGPRSRAIKLGVNQHCCHLCYPDYIEWEKMELARAGEIDG